MASSIKSIWAADKWGPLPPCPSHDLAAAPIRRGTTLAPWPVPQPAPWLAPWLAPQPTLWPPRCMSLPAAASRWGYRARFRAWMTSHPLPTNANQICSTIVKWWLVYNEKFIFYPNLSFCVLLLDWSALEQKFVSTKHELHRLSTRLWAYEFVFVAERYILRSVPWYMAP
jgi:hypothetical protein